MQVVYSGFMWAFLLKTAPAETLRLKNKVEQSSESEPVKLWLQSQNNEQEDAEILKNGFTYSLLIENLSSLKFSTSNENINICIKI